MRSFVEMMPCFRKFDRNNFACGFGCSIREKCEEQTPVELMNAVTEITPDEEMEPMGDVLPVSTEPSKTKSSSSRKRGKKKNDAPASRFDIIDISKEEK